MASTRRQFLSSAAALVAAPAVVRGQQSANDRVRVAVVGLRGRGRRSIGGALVELAKQNVEIAAVCDCDEARMNACCRRVCEGPGQAAGDDPRVSEAAGRQVDRRGGPGHAQPLACLGDDLGLPGGQGRLRYYTFLGPDRKPGPSSSVPGNPMMDLDHVANWIAAVCSRNPGDLHAEIEEGHLSSTLSHLANVAYYTGRTLEFDPKSERFAGDDEANRLLTRPYRAPYVVPNEV